MNAAEEPKASEVLLGRLDDEQVDALLATLRQSGHLASVTPAGAPQVGAVWYWWDRPTLWVVTFRDSLRARNIEQEPRVSMSIDADRFPAIGAVLSGTAELVPAENTIIRKIVARYLPAERVEAQAERYAADPNRLLLRITVTRVAGWNAGGQR